MRKIKTVIIGLGRIGFEYSKTTKNYSYFDNLKRLKNVSLVGVCDSKINNLKAFNKLKILFYKDYKKMINELKVDLVIISSSDETHYEIALYCIKKKIKYIITEKPITNSLYELKKLDKMVRSNKINFEINYSRQFISFFLILKKRLKYDFSNIIDINISFNNGLLHNGCHYLILLFYLFGQKNISVVYSNLTPSKIIKKDFCGKIILKIKKKFLVIINIFDVKNFSIDEIDFVFKKKRIFISGDYANFYKIKKHEKFFNFKSFHLIKKKKINYDKALKNLIKLTLKQKSGKVTNNMHLTKEMIILTKKIIEKNVNK